MVTNGKCISMILCGLMGVPQLDQISGILNSEWRECLDTLSEFK